LEETILIISRDPGERDRLARMVQELGWKCWATSGLEAARGVLRDLPVSLVVAGTEPAAEHDPAWVAQLAESCPETPVALVGPGLPSTASLDALRDGALEFVPRESSMDEMGRRLREAFARRERWIAERRCRRELQSRVEAHERTLLGTHRQVLEALGAALDTRDPETQDHTRRVIEQSVQIGRHLGIQGEPLREIEWGAALHDVGKIGIPDAVLLKPGSLTREEWITMKQHCEIGYRMLSGISFLRCVLPIVLHHHERFDGTGYPFGLAGEEIPFGARIFAVADAYDAMTSDRPYRRALPATAALAELLRCAGSQFDPRVVHAFVGAAPEVSARAA
jgi:HD-GYP domain-containing protein (c-di-GMP phosphodiesterase class II)